MRCIGEARFQKWDHLVRDDFDLAMLQRPWSVMDVATVQGLLVLVEEAVTFGKKVFQRPLVSSEGLAGRPVLCLKRAIVFRSSVESQCAIVDGIVAGVALHVRKIVWQVEENPCAFNSDSARCVQREKIYSSFVAAADIRAHVEFREAQPGDGTPPRPQCHLKWNNTEPGPPVEHVKLE